MENLLSGRDRPTRATESVDGPPPRRAEAEMSRWRRTDFGDGGHEKL